MKQQYKSTSKMTNNNPVQSDNQRRNKIENLIGTLGANSLGGMSFSPNRYHETSSYPNQNAPKDTKNELIP